MRRDPASTQSPSKPRQLELELYPAGRGKTETGVAELKSVLPWWHLDVPRRRHGFAINQELLDHDPGRVLVNLQVSRVDHGDPLECGEPQAPILGLPPGRLKAAIAFVAGHSVGFAIGNALNGLDLPFRKFVQILLTGTIDAPVATHPEIALVILEDLVHGAVEQSLSLRVGGELAVLESAQPGGT